MCVLENLHALPMLIMSLMLTHTTHATSADPHCPHMQGGGLCELENLRTLCVACHADVTKAQTQERAAEKRRWGAAGPLHSMAYLADLWIMLIAPLFMSSSVFNSLFIQWPSWQTVSEC
jgi:hypothetical protein